MRRRANRRVFLKRAAGSAGGMIILQSSRSAWGAPANTKLHVAIIGCGGRGKTFVDSMPSMENVVALCDVNQERAAQSFRQLPSAKRYGDFRKMLDEMGPQIDAVIVATPDHTHAVASAAAIRAGKHVYTEKPLTRTVRESRALRELAAKSRLATSMGNQGTASGPFRRALELIRGGVLGRIQEVHAWNDQGGAGRPKPPTGEEPVPSWLQWDLWLGPARQRPFHPQWLAWHAWRDFGTANLGNWASHTLNLAFMAMKVDSLWHADSAAKPILRVEAKVREINRVSFPRWEMVRWDIPARGDLPPLPFYWHNGSSAPGMRDQLEGLLGRGLDWGDKGAKKWADWAGCLIVGTEGKIYATAHNATFTMLPEEEFKDVQKDRPEKVEPSRGHEQDWLSACRGGKAAWANYGYAGPLTEFNMLGNVATQFEGPLEYDPLAGKIVNHAEADKALGSEYRQGWRL
jgi:predicted dehydrogenase